MGQQGKAFDGQDGCCGGGGGGSDAGDQPGGGGGGEPKFIRIFFGGGGGGGGAIDYGGSPGAPSGGMQRIQVTSSLILVKVSMGSWRPYR